MKTVALALLAMLPANAQFLVPEWRGGENSNHAEWDVFTKPKFELNSPDVAPDDATLLCTTSSAFLTGAGNIYSFQAPTYFQLDDTTTFPVRNVFLQLSALGSGIEVTAAKLIFKNSEGERVVRSPTQTFIASEEELTGENGGIGTTYGIQWDLSTMPVSGDYIILFNAIESSMSLGNVSLDTSGTFVEVVKPRSLSVRPVGDEIIVTWYGNRQLQSSASLESGWTEVPGSSGVNTITLPRSIQATYFRLVQPTVTE